MYDFQMFTDKKQQGGTRPERIYLTLSTWNDYSFRTLFSAVLVDKKGKQVFLGQIKIGFVDQDEDKTTYDAIGDKPFKKLGAEYFSLAESPEFYEVLYAQGPDVCQDVLQALRCVVVNEEAMDVAKNERVFQRSLLRDLNINTIEGQFKRIVNGEKALIEFDFEFVRKNHKYSDMNLGFSVDPFSLPPSNIHAIIGRNGLGKTTLLNEMFMSLNRKVKANNAYFENEFGERIGDDFFSTVVSVSFSAFDPFRPIKEQNDPLIGSCFYYIGLKQDVKFAKLDLSEHLNTLHANYALSVFRCCSDDSKKKMWLEAISDLESDTNFADLNMKEVAEYQPELIALECQKRMKKMSSGHAVVFMAISRLVEVVQDRTLILFDEPESHLHPPLLSAFVRSLSKLLAKRNGVAIMATHSPVVVQEIPKDCCWVLTRFGDETDCARPSIETFAENVGKITKEVFKLEMEQSGFHKLLKDKVKEGHSFKEILRMFKKKIGIEGQALLMSMIMLRDSEAETQGREDD
ncbi:AAA family ATPase [Pantoea agglomerans]|uniref:AAA family ATPase n=1 Tax=Enterobacter agglomerans TaxID=549 RepID=UPI001785CFAC|nr:AAA family ATPase [Pantoea agglomerans]MBD8156011.1 AAA family ATPase [Pantoea agglomerans]